MAAAVPADRGAGSLRRSPLSLCGGGLRVRRHRVTRASILVEHDPFGKPVSILGSSPRTGFFRIMLLARDVARFCGVLTLIVLDRRRGHPRQVPRDDDGIEVLVSGFRQPVPDLVAAE